jgi:hypothetical protein
MTKKLKKFSAEKEITHFFDIPIRIQGFDDQKIEKIYSGKRN